MSFTPFFMPPQQRHLIHQHTILPKTNHRFLHREGENLSQQMYKCKILFYMQYKQYLYALSNQAPLGPPNQAYQAQIVCISQLNTHGLINNNFNCTRLQLHRPRARQADLHPGHNHHLYHIICRDIITLSPFVTKMAPVADPPSLPDSPSFWTTAVSERAISYKPYCSYPDHEAA